MALSKPLAQIYEAQAQENFKLYCLPRDHHDRNVAVALKLRPIYEDYRLLHRLSQTARYYPDKPKPTPALLQRYENEPFSRIVSELQKRGAVLIP
jgi:hypothetical protein